MGHLSGLPARLQRRPAAQHAGGDLDMDLVGGDYRAGVHSNRIASAALLSDLDIGDGFSQQEGVFWIQAVATADRSLLTIDASVEVGRLKLRVQEE